MNRQVVRLAALASVPTIASAIGAAPVAADAPIAEVPSASQLATLSQGEVALLNSGDPIDVVMDPSTGDIDSVAAAAKSAAQISNHDVCNSGDGCYATNKVPYADQGFYGTAGTYYGSWAYRSGYSSGNYTVSACWAPSSCGVKIGRGSHVTFTSDVTGTSFTIY
jgi:hypothetical protein